MKSLIAATVLVCSTFAFVMPSMAQVAARPGGRPPGGFGMYPEPYKPTLVAKSKTYFLHGLSSFAGDYPYSRFVNDSTTLTYTSRETGEMTFLYTSGRASTGDIKGSYSIKRILGIAFDGNRIYLCVWHTGRVNGQLPEDFFTLANGSVRLMIFQSANGAFVQEILIQPEKDLSKVSATDDFGTGPLRIVKNGVSCFDQTFELDKEQLVPVVPKKTPSLSDQTAG